MLAVWFPGQEAGDALADVLSGDSEPGGRLPVSWPADEASVPVSETRPTDGALVYSEGVHLGYRAWLRSGVRPQFAFGHGLGYTRWQLEFADTPEVMAAGTNIAVGVHATNTGERSGRTVIQLYAERVSPSNLDRPARWLVAFDTVDAKAGEMTSASLELSWRSLATWSETGWEAEPGIYRLHLATSSVDLVAHRDIELVR